MQVHDTVVTNSQKIKSAKYKTLGFLSWLFKFFALECSIEGAKKSTPKIIIITIVIVIVQGILVSTSLYFRINYVYDRINISIKYTDAVQTIYDYCQYIVDLYFVYHYGRHIGLEYFKQYDNIDKILNIPSYSAVKGRLMKMTVFFTLLWLANSICDYIAWMLTFGWIIPLMYSVAYIYLLVKILTTLDFSSHVMRIEIRLQVIGDVLVECYNNIACSPQFIGDLICNRNWLYKDRQFETVVIEAYPAALRILPNDDKVAVQWLTRCYLMLTEQVAYINAMYGIRILLNSLSLLIDMVRFTNIVVRVVVGSQVIHYTSRYFPAASSLLRLLTCVALIISLVIHCEQAYRQRERILNIIDHLLIIKKPSEELTSSLNELRTLVQDRPIVFNVANFFQLKNSLLLSTASVVVTYTIILLQSIK